MAKADGREDVAEVGIYEEENHHLGNDQVVALAMKYIASPRKSTQAREL